MIYLNALELLRRHTSLPFSWCEVVVGYDFGILSAREIQDWIRSTAPLGEEAEKVVSLEGSDLLRFEASLWAACVEATGARVSRPGHQRWAHAQDLWRTALLKETLTWQLDDQEFGEAVETIINRVGCPDDMLGLVKSGCAWAKRAASSDRAAVEAFVRNLEDKQEGQWISLAAS
jgi:hypothetical protein